MSDTPSETEAAPASPSAATTPVAPTRTGRTNRRKTRDGTVVSTKMDKTVVVAVVERVRHARYQKTLQRTKKLLAHDEVNDLKEGDRVRVQETRPLSRTKRWRVVEVLERAR